MRTQNSGERIKYKLTLFTYKIWSNSCCTRWWIFRWCWIARAAVGRRLVEVGRRRRGVANRSAKECHTSGSSSEWEEDNTYSEGLTHAIQRNCVGVSPPFLSLSWIAILLRAIRIDSLCRLRKILSINSHSKFDKMTIFFYSALKFCLLDSRGQSECLILFPHLYRRLEEYTRS